jgi:FKBP-type peptidyl-prolyl cis-trans isomerase FkpA
MKIPFPVLLGWLLASACATTSPSSTTSADAEREKGKAFQDQAAQEPGAVRTESGLIYQELTAGTGASPQASDVVRAHYRGTTIDGKEFDSSYRRGEPELFPLGDVIRCWTEGLQRMKVGGKARLVCPPELAYGDRGAPPDIAGGATLIFEVELVDLPGNP